LRLLSKLKISLTSIVLHRQVLSDQKSSELRVLALIIMYALSREEVFHFQT